MIIAIIIPTNVWPCSEVLWAVYYGVTITEDGETEMLSVINALEVPTEADLQASLSLTSPLGVSYTIVAVSTVQLTAYQSGFTVYLNQPILQVDNADVVAALIAALESESSTTG